MDIVFNFYGCCVYNTYPKIGQEVLNCVSTLRKLQDKGYKLACLVTHGDHSLEDIEEWFQKKGLIGVDVVEHLTQQPDILIHSKGFGCPLTHSSYTPRPYVNWYEIELLLREKKVI